MKHISRYLAPALLIAASLPAGTFSCSAQIQASQEPRHHIAFENSLVRILDVRIPPGDTSLMHKHSLPSIFVVLSNTKTGSQVIIEPVKPHFTEGNIWFEGFYDKPRIHRVWNSDTTEFHTIDLELLNKKTGSAIPALTGQGIAPLFNESAVSGYRVSLEPQARLDLQPHGMGVVLIGLTNTTGAVTANDHPFVKKGDFLFIPADKEIKFSNSGGAKEEFALFELK